MANLTTVNRQSETRKIVDLIKDELPGIRFSNGVNDYIRGLPYDFEAFNVVEPATEDTRKRLPVINLPIGSLPYPRVMFDVKLYYILNTDSKPYKVEVTCFGTDYQEVVEGLVKKILALDFNVTLDIKYGHSINIPYSD